jgi:hypothetical protein
MHWEEHGKEKEDRLQNGSFFCLYRTRIGRNVVENTPPCSQLGGENHV